MWFGYLGCVQRVGTRSSKPSFIPAWSDKPLLKSIRRRSAARPRETDSLCPTCTREARQAISRQEGRQRALTEGQRSKRPSRARRQDSDGKDCRSTAISKTRWRWIGFLRTLKIFPGRTSAHNDEAAQHGSTVARPRSKCRWTHPPRDIATLFHGRERFGFVHELSWEDIKTVLDNAITKRRNVGPVLAAADVSPLPRRVRYAPD